MSTKIYDASRMPTGRLNDFLDATRANVWEDFLARTERLVHGLKQSYIEEQKKEAQWEGFDFDTRPEWADKYIRWELVEQKYRKAAGTNKKGLFDADAGWNIWLHSDGYAYAIYWGREYEHGAKELGFAEFFGYWDNTDPPEDTPDEEFWARGDVWEGVCLGFDKWNKRRLFHSLVDFEEGHYVSSLKVEKHLGLW